MSLGTVVGGQHSHEMLGECVRWVILQARQTYPVILLRISISTVLL